MRFIFAADIHSDVNQYYELRKLITDSAADFLVLGGDLFAYTQNVQEQIGFINGFLKPKSIYHTIFGPATLRNFE